jgi:hypothetical protein
MTIQNQTPEDANQLRSVIASGEKKSDDVSKGAATLKPVRDVSSLKMTSPF